MPRSKITTVLARLAVGLLAFVGLIFAAIYGGSEWLLRREHDVPLEPFVTRAVAADSLEGRRKAILVGCLAGCHGLGGQGGVEDAAGIFRATAPTLSAVVPQYSDPEIVRLIRYGVMRNGKSAIGMPSATFFPLSDTDLGQIIGYLRQLPVVPAKPQSRDVQLLGRIALVTNQWNTSADGVDPTRPRWGHLPLTTPMERGRYMASIVCSECHGQDLRGDKFLRSPALSVVRGYQLNQFQHLMRTGEPVSGRKLGLMRTVATQALVHFTDEEVGNLHEYLRTLP